MTELSVTITKELIERSAMCGFEKVGNNIIEAPGFDSAISKNCLFALAMRDIFPKAHVCSDFTLPFGWDTALIIKHDPNKMIYHSDEIEDFISWFDMLTPTERIQRIKPGRTFTFCIPDEVINQIDISSITEQLQNHSILKLQVA